MIVAILLILSQPCVQGSPLANGGGKANGLKNFAALNSSTSDHGSNGTYEFSSAYWDSIIPPFGDFPNDTTGRPDLHRPDKDVFQFTEDNIRDSFVQVWFPAWTRERQKDWLWESHGETYLFGMDFLGNGDYFCDISVASCMQQPHVHRILELWPGLENRALAQRIYLLAKMMEVDHHEQRAGLVCYSPQNHP
jgi:hypothetical protein